MMKHEIIQRRKEKMLNALYHEKIHKSLDWNRTEEIIDYNFFILEEEITNNEMIE